MRKIKEKQYDSFEEDVLVGLSSIPKYLPSKYFYNEEGDRIFQAIMGLPEYYITKSEHEIISTNKKEILSLFQESGRFKLIEFGAGDGFKTKVLLEHFLQEKSDFKYFPIDISENAVDGIVQNLSKSFPGLHMEGICDEYFSALRELDKINGSKKVILFLGSSIGNFTHDQALDFLKELYNHLHEGDLLMIGFDLKKDPAVILQAYNDSYGVTKEFNMNLLKRINRELDADFNLLNFQHYPSYDPVKGEARSYLISTKRQAVSIKKLDTAIQFEAWEPIHTEISSKYDLNIINSFAIQSGFFLRRNFFDSKKYFVDSVWEK